MYFKKLLFTILIKQIQLSAKYKMICTYILISNAILNYNDTCLAIHKYKVRKYDAKAYIKTRDFARETWY